MDLYIGPWAQLCHGKENAPKWCPLLFAEIVYSLPHEIRQSTGT